MNHLEVDKVRFKIQRQKQHEIFKLETIAIGKTDDCIIYIFMELADIIKI